MMNIRTPKELSGESAKFWKRNAPVLASDGRLTVETKDGFLLLCQIWEKYITAGDNGEDPIKVVALSKQVQQLMNSYGMTPASRKRLKLDESTDDVATAINKILDDDDAE